MSAECCGAHPIVCTCQSCLTCTSTDWRTCPRRQADAEEPAP